MIGIQETKEALIGINELSIVLAQQLKDGFQVGSDLAAIVGKWQSDADFQAKLTAAFIGIQKVPDEIKDLDLSEGIELASIQLAYVPKIVEALKK
jgi:hypothetical protein